MPSKLRRLFSFRRSSSPPPRGDDKSIDRRKYVSRDEYRKVEEELEDERHNSLRNQDRFVDLHSKMLTSLERAEKEKQESEETTTIQIQALKNDLMQSERQVKSLSQAIVSKDLTIRLMKVEYQRTINSDKGVGGWMRRFFTTEEIDLMKAAVDSLPTYKPSTDKASGNGSEKEKEEDVVDALKCGICEEEFTETAERTPRMLNCGHTMCQDCVTKYLRANPLLLCPWDRIETARPYRPLPKNFALLEIIRSVTGFKKSSKKEEEMDVETLQSKTPSSDLFDHSLDNPFGYYTSATHFPTFDRNAYRNGPARRQTRFWN